MNIKKTIVLTGAGAAIPWGAPTTKKITDTLLLDLTFRSYTGQSIGSWLHHKLIGLYHRDPATVNFETIINALEYLITFYSSKERSSIARFKNVMPAFFEEKDYLEEILSFNKIYDIDNDNWYSNNDNDKFISSWNENDDFFVNVLRRFIHIIICQIEIYSKELLNKVDLNRSLNDFLSSINNPLRCYTTNYDRLIPKVFTGDMFEGFSDNNGSLKFDLKKVLNDETSNIYYNMHGSVHYKYDKPNNVKLVIDDYEYNFNKGINNDKDKMNRHNSNIITGFNKSSKILTNPYSHFYLRFSLDCLNADKIYIIGYSFSDFHINNAIKTALLANSKLKILCVTYMMDNNIQGIENQNEWIVYDRKGKKFLTEDFKRNIEDEIMDKSISNRIFVYRYGFEQFLNNKQWLKY